MMIEVVKFLSSYGASRAATPYGTPEAIANSRGHADLAAWLVASRGWTPLAHLESLGRGTCAFGGVLTHHSREEHRRIRTYS